ncbi:MAG: GNAT family N-acetyltransferase [Acidobacteria bacterium]|nr:GNAT family N-acetyltransferase [Acidobacteriota bacterium]
MFFIDINKNVEAMVGAYASDGAHATLWGMWIAPELRGTGVATGLVDAVEGWAAENSLDRVELCSVVVLEPDRKLLVS